ncbi:hypothetical protein C8R46DRAFT_1211326 [Mycena filopes]|nr:hypothetical protein C8R46DRAFT_1211326 [Mycena filopes]
MLFLSTPFAALILLSSVNAVPLERALEQGNDLHCPEGFHAGFVHNSYTYNVSADKFIDITKSFYDNSWYGAVVNSTTGTDNVVGATRAGNANGDFNETLTAYSLQPSALEYTYLGAPYTYTPTNSTAATVHYASYAETLRVESVCDGRATYLDIIEYLCSAEQVPGYDLGFLAHEIVFPALAARVGATAMDGDCPGM